MRLGIFGGAFDPPHLGHLRIAESAREAAELDRVLWVPSGDPPHKPPHAASGADRLRMVEAAISDHPRFAACPMELHRPGHSYTIDTLLAIAEQYPGASLYFITGSDAIRELETWRTPERIVAICRLLAAPRPGDGEVELAESLPPEFMKAVEMLPPSPFQISSSAIREKAGQGRSIRYLVPESVRLLIEQAGLYR